MKSLLALAVLSSALGGCSGDDHPPPLDDWRALPECPNHDYSTCDTRNAQCQARLLSLAGCLFGVDRPPSVPIHVVSEDELREQLEAAQPAQPAQEDPTELVALAHFENTFVDLGLARLGDLTGVGAISHVVDSVDGVYIDAKRGISLVDRGQAKNDADAGALLLHELIHALQDAEYDLGSWRAQQPASLDATLALRTVTEGQASFYQLRVIVAMLGYDVEQVDFDELFARYRQDVTDQAYDDSSPLLGSFRTFPYGFGAGLAYDAWQREGKRFHTTQFAEPPLSTYEVMRRNVEPSLPSIVPSEPPEPTAIADYTLVDQSLLGAFLLELFLVRHGIDVYSAREGALTWRGDKLWIYGGPNAETAWIWELELASSAAAAMFESVGTLAPGLVLETNGARAFIAGGSDAAPFLLDAGRDFLNAVE